jgi:fluoride exporter
VVVGFLIVFLGAGIGGAVRHGVNLAMVRLGVQSFPASTMLINILGSLLMGAIAEYFAIRSQLPQQWRLFLTTGILGGFTTFSAFSLEAALLYERGRIGLALVYVIGSVVLSIAALAAAMLLVRGAVRPL